jgi:hypothetical protein
MSVKKEIAPAVLTVMFPTDVVTLEITAGYACEVVAGRNSTGRTAGEVMVTAPAAPAGTAAFTRSGRLRVTVPFSITYDTITDSLTLFHAVLLKVAENDPTSATRGVLVE